MSCFTALRLPRSVLPGISSVNSASVRLAGYTAEITTVVALHCQILLASLYAIMSPSVLWVLAAPPLKHGM